MVEFIEYWKGKANIRENWFCRHIGIRQERLIDWRKRRGIANQHNGKMPREYWLSEEEKDAIEHFYLSHREDGYRRCAYMMIDQDIAFASPTTVYRVLKERDALRMRGNGPTKKGTGFDQPMKAHEHWHTDISYVKIGDRFFFLICVLDGFSRAIVHWDLREEMKDKDVGIVQMAALEKYPDVNPRYITDNGKQFTGGEFKKFIALHGLTHVRTSPYYPQSNGKIERFHGTIKSECIRRSTLVDQDHAKKVILPYVDYYNKQRLHSSIGYVTPFDKLEGRAAKIQQDRDRKLDLARQLRKLFRETERKSENQDALDCHPLGS